MVWVGEYLCPNFFIATPFSLLCQCKLFSIPNQNRSMFLSFVICLHFTVPSRCEKNIENWEFIRHWLLYLVGARISGVKNSLRLSWVEWGFSISSSPYLLLNRKRCWDLGGQGVRGWQDFELASQWTAKIPRTWTCIASVTSLSSHQFKCQSLEDAFYSFYFPIFFLPFHSVFISLQVICFVQCKISAAIGLFLIMVFS